MHEQAPAFAGPTNELRAFDKPMLAPGEQKTLSFTLGRRDFAHYDPRARAWRVNPGRFEIRVGGSSRDLPLTLVLQVQARRPPKRLSRQSLVQDFIEMAPLYEEFVRALGFASLLDEDAPAEGRTPEEANAARKARTATLAFVNEMPINKVPAFSHGALSDARVDEMVEIGGAWRAGGAND